MTRVNVRADYRAFLRAKVVPGVRYEGHFAILPTWDGASAEVSAALLEFAPHLHGYQRFAATFAVARQRAALFLECGLGKTSIALAWVEHVRAGRPAIICAPLAALHEFEAERDRFYPGVPLRRVETRDVGRWLSAPEGVALVTHHAFAVDRDLTGIAAIVLDECFAADTPVDVVGVGGTAYRKYIKDIRVGDRILNAAGVDVVADVHRREVPYVVRVTVNGERITSSPNHPYFTQRGWVGAADLRPGDHALETAAGMRLLRDGVCPEVEGEWGEGADVLRAILLSEMANAPAGERGAGAFAGGGRAARREQGRVVSLGGPEGCGGAGADRSPQPELQTRGAGENLPPIESHAPRTFRAWRERPRAYDPAGDPTGCVVTEAGAGIQLVVGAADSGLSHALQARFGVARAEARRRGGWVLAREPQAFGREEGREAGFARVDRVEVLEPGHPDLERLRDADGKLYLYDLGATRHPSFSVAGLLVHNSSILKSGDGAIAGSLVRSCRPVPYRLALSATPAPNDPTEYATHATWLGYMRSDAEFRARFFVRDGREWRVKGHAKEALPRWLARFALWMTDPAAYGMPCSALPADDYLLRYVPLPTAADVDMPRDLFGSPDGAMDMSTRAKVRASLYDAPERTAAVVELARGHRTIVWAMRNGHADALERALRAAGLRVAQIAGATDDEDRVAAVRAFQAGGLDVLVSKPSVIGHGVNLQAADREVFAGYDESYEAMHQAIRRAHRQGRTGRLEVYVLVSPEEGPVVHALETKAGRWKEDAARQEAEFVRALAGDLEAYRTGRTMVTYADAPERLAPVESEHFRLIHGDSIEEMAGMPPESVDLACFSPPFSSLFTYSSESADMGNCSDQAEEEFGLHFAHFCDALVRVMKPGRVVALHLAQLIAFRARHGRKGLRDFRGAVIRAMEDAGFHYYGEFVVPKNPQAAAIRTKSERLQFAQFTRDSLESSPALNDYVLEFRKPGTQAVQVKNDVSNEEWIAWASGVWGDIRETDVLSYHAARSEADEKHVCPLQLAVIERVVRLWSNPGEVVFSPFAGIGSEPYTAVRLRRFGLGVELKAEYLKQAAGNCRRAESETYSQLSILAEDVA